MDPGSCDPGEITADANAWIIQTFCPAAGVRSVRLDLGEREDTATVSLDVPTTLLGGPGADRLTGGPAADQLNGDDGDDVLDGGDGADVVIGGPGLDEVSGAAGGAARCHRRQRHRGATELAVTLSRARWRQALRALRRRRPVSVGMTVVATDGAGNSRQAKPVTIRLLR
jgi:Ca2+-binding RTX toxin-like protein